MEHERERNVRRVLNSSKPNRGGGRSRFKLLSLALLVVAGLVLAACGSDSSSGTDSGSTAATSGESETTSGGGISTRAPGEAATEEKIPLLKAGVAFQVSNLNMSVPTGSFGGWLASLSLETLVVIDENGELQPWLAEEWSQPSPTVYEYKLREGVKFSDGTELTADDVAFSLNYFRRPDAAFTATYYTSVKSVTAKDKHTVVVTLKEPNASWKFIPGLEVAAIFSKKFFEESNGKYGQPGTLIMGTGPWVFDSLNPTSGAELSANPDYWGGPVPTEKISVKFFTDENSMALAMRAGEIDLVPSVAEGPSFEAASGGVTQTDGPSCQTGFFSMPTQSGPWSDIHVRRAVAHILNREDVITATGFSAVPTETLIPETSLLTQGDQAEVDAALESLPQYETDLAAAEAEMAKSKYPDGFDTELQTFDYGSFLPVDQVIAAQLKEIGINVDINNVGQTAWFAAITGPAEKRPLTYTTTGTCTPDPSYYDIYLGTANLAEGGLNIANWAPPEVDKLMKEGLAAPDGPERLAIYTEMLDKLATDVPYVPLYVQGVIFASDKYEWPGYDGFWHNRPWALDLVPTP